MTREQRLEKALTHLVEQVTDRNRLSEEDELSEPHKARRHQQIDFTYAHLRKIGRALRLAREALGAVDDDAQA